MSLGDSNPASKAAVILNPGSFRTALRERWSQIEALTRNRGVTTTRVRNLEEIDTAVHDAVRSQAETLILIGGDGTLQAAVTALAETASARPPPRLMILGGGRTNYVARDLGSHGHLIATLQAALDRPTALHVKRRNSLCVQQAGLAAQHGFFFGGALVDDVIRDCQRYREGRGLWRRGHLSTPIRLAQRGVLALLGRSRFDPPRMVVDARGLGRLEGPIRLLLVATLEHRDQFIDPYAGRGDGTIRLTAVAAGAPAFWRRLYRLIRGRYHARMNPQAGYLSGATDRLVIHGLSGISLDGQTFDFDPDQPVDIHPGPEFEFLCP